MQGKRTDALKKAQASQRMFFFSDTACLSQIFSKFLICSPFYQPVFFYSHIAHMVPNGYPSTHVYIAYSSNTDPQYWQVCMYQSLNPWKEIDWPACLLGTNHKMLSSLLMYLWVLCQVFPQGSVRYGQMRVRTEGPAKLSSTFCSLFCYFLTHLVPKISLNK